MIQLKLTTRQISSSANDLILAGKMNVTYSVPCNAQSPYSLPWASPVTPNSMTFGGTPLPTSLSLTSFSLGIGSEKTCPMRLDLDRADNKPRRRKHKKKKDKMQIEYMGGIKHKASRRKSHVKPRPEGRRMRIREQKSTKIRQEKNSARPARRHGTTMAIDQIQHWATLLPNSRELKTRKERKAMSVFVAGQVLDLSSQLQGLTF